MEEIFLFGSHAYGTPHRDSNLDLYVVLRDECLLWYLDAGLQIRMAIACKKSIPVGILARKKKDFTRRLSDINPGAHC